ncbi:GNAT acetyltransferase-like protein [Murinocardiopsis flavida]|uniref:GNAT acetyltransferase-like protein n=1 Tax=Murinocardiopsis flavida TaxID=645275 RepID=A0A2P8DF95_9ACTN|nr:GNAT family N-acetyltransferase [Murinocardiopsis flavida]PSK95879.1 GNAT acetyltransferase-like protein [Murinocardiopsis flavida]
MPTGSAEDASAAALLNLEMAMLWDGDDHGRLHHGAHYVALGVADDGLTAAVGAAVPDPLAAELADLAVLPRGGPECAPPTTILRCARLLRGRLGPVEVSGGPSYLVPPGVRAESTARVVRSTDGAGTGALRGANPGTWADGEWHALLDGRFGPWAAAVDGERVVALCCTPVFSDRAAEAGVWTRPSHRGRGHAASVTAHWASAFGSDGRRLFYSTSAANTASQRVAERLGLRRLGWIWKVSRPGEQGSHVERTWGPPAIG